MAFTRRNLQTDLPHPVHSRQLGLFEQFGLTWGAVEASLDAVRVELGSHSPPVDGAPAPERPGLASTARRP